MNSKLFQSVLKSNLQTFSDSLISKSEDLAHKLNSMQLTEDETRQFAVDFFNAELSKLITERLKNKLFI